MKKKIRGFYLIISSCLIALLNLAFAVAKSATGYKPVVSAVPVAKKGDPGKPVLPTLRSVYDSLHLNISGLSQQAFEHAKIGFNKLVQQGRFLNDSIISI